MASVRFDSGLVTPLPKALIGSSCQECDKPQANWKLMRSQSETPFICSVCLLYESHWGQDNAEDIGILVENVGASMGAPLAVELDGRLVPHEADRIMFSIVASNKAWALRERMERKAAR